MTRTDRQARRHFFTTLAALPLLAALAFAPEGARAQWATSGDNISNTNAGNVGVGTADPDQKLGVEGMFGIYPTTWTGPTRRGLFIFHGGTAGGSIYAYNYPAGTGDPIGLSASSFGFSTFVSGSPHQRLTLANNGNLGIGTTAPDTDLVGTFEYGPAVKVLQLDSTQPRTIIRGSLDAGLDLIDTGAGANAKWMQLYSNGGVTKFRSLTDTGTIQGDNILVFDNSTGNVGVGTASPGSRFFVGPGAPAVATLPGVNVALGGNSYVSASNGTVNTFIGADNTVTYGMVGTLSNHPLGLRANNAVAVTVHPNGNVRIGTAAAAPAERLHVEGDLNATGTIRGGNIETRFQDVAEWVPSRQQLAAGTVVVLDTTANNHVVASTAAYDTGVAGVVSEQPGLILGEGGAGKVMVATTGRVRVRVDARRAPVRIGDLLVTGDTPGMAMKSEPMMIGGRKLHAPGTIVGKALEPLEKGVGEILVLLSLQ